MLVLYRLYLGPLITKQGLDTVGMSPTSLTLECRLGRTCGQHTLGPRKQANNWQTSKQTWLRSALHDDYSLDTSGGWIPSHQLVATRGAT